MNLQDFGYRDSLQEFKTRNESLGFTIGRIATEHKERYIVKTESGDVESEITGSLRYSAFSREDFPAVGDWVSLSIFDEFSSIIHEIAPRESVIKRKSINSSDVQVIAANIDYALIVQSADRDFNINRLERYMAICNTSKVQPIFVINKIDLIDKDTLTEMIATVNASVEGLIVIPISNVTQEGYETLLKHITKGKTFCLLGSSGVGKSTLTNILSGKEGMKTSHISDSTGKGRHVTSHRELTILENGAIIIDNPGMREVGIADASSGIEETFNQIMEYASSCHYRDCAHINEKGCAVIQAVEDGIIDHKSYENFLKLEKEKDHYEASVQERKQKDKDFGKMLKNYKKDLKKVGKKGY